MNKNLALILTLSLIVSMAVFSFTGRSNTASATSSNDEIVGSWISYFTDGKFESIYQFKKDGKLYVYRPSSNEDVMVFNYSYSPKTDTIAINGKDYYCSACENGLIITNRFSGIKYAVLSRM